MEVLKHDIAEWHWSPESQSEPLWIQKKGARVMMLHDPFDKNHKLDHTALRKFLACAMLRPELNFIIWTRNAITAQRYFGDKYYPCEVCAYARDYRLMKEHAATTPLEVDYRGLTPEFIERGYWLPNVTLLYRFSGPVAGAAAGEIDAFLNLPVAIRGFYFDETATTFNFAPRVFATEYVPAGDMVSSTLQRREVIDLVEVDKRKLHWIVSDTQYSKVANRTTEICIETGLPIWLGMYPTIRQYPAEFIPAE